jgi:CheY-like chemotaxis protein
MNPSAGTLRILVADDNPVNRKVVLGLLKKIGYDAEGVEDDRQVLEALACRNYDIIFMDCQMPGLNGCETAAEIRRRENTAHRSWIIALTANSLARDREACLASGMDDYVAKPASSEVLATAIARCPAFRNPTATREAEKAIRFMQEASRRLRQRRRDFLASVPRPGSCEPS